MNEKGYIVPAKSVRTEFVEKKSRFISTLARVESVEEADAFIAKIKKEFPDATHNCAAYRIKTPLVERFFDDGEPSGTAGMPMLEVLKKEELFNVAVVVTRYFGGILLGAGGLVRAYSKGASDAVQMAGICKMEQGVRVRVSCNYSVFERLQRIWARFSPQLLESSYAENVATEMMLKAPYFEEFSQTLMDASAGTVVIESLESVYYPFEL